MKKNKKIKFIPLVTKCTYHYPKEKHGCPNCKGTGKYQDGYYMIIGKTAWFVDTIK